MNSIQFPNMLYHNSVQMVSDQEASMQNLKLLLGSEKGEFRFDPFFGIRLKRYLFDQNNFVLRDILLDEIYEQIVYFMPQITVKKSDIKIVQEGSSCYLTLKGVNNLDFTLNTYNLVLFEEQE